MNTQKRKKLQFYKKLVVSLLTAMIVLFLAVFFTFIPFRLLLPAYALPLREEGELRLHFLALGEGECTFVEFPNGDVIVVDAGGGTFADDNYIYRYLSALSPRELYLVATDSDSFHVGGMASLFEVFPVTEAYLPAIPADTGSYKRFLGAAEKEGCPVRNISRYTAIRNESGAYCVCVSPYSSENTQKKNECAVALYLNYQGVGIFLSGDMSDARETRIIAEYGAAPDILDARGCPVRLEDTRILRVAAHGSNESSSVDWLELLGAETAILACNSALAPSGEVLQRLKYMGSKVYRTDELDTIVVSVKEGGYRVIPHFGK